MLVKNLNSVNMIIKHSQQEAYMDLVENGGGSGHQEIKKKHINLHLKLVKNKKLHNTKNTSFHEETATDREKQTKIWNQNFFFKFKEIHIKTHIHEHDTILPLFNNTC